MQKTRTQLAAVVALSVLGVGAFVSSASGRHLERAPVHGHGLRGITYAIIGDTPYGDEQIADFSNLIGAINDDEQVSGVVHVGDIKNGSSDCSDDYFSFVYDSFTSFADSVVYTPGDNEWTDCHRSAAGKYDPIDRLEAIRDVFFSDANWTLGAERLPVLSQGRFPKYRDLPENQAWIAARTVFATAHVVGSRNNLAPWFGDDLSDGLEDDPIRREAEVARRTEAALAWINLSFSVAERPAIQGLVLFMHADTWPGGENDGFSEIIQVIAERSVLLSKPVLVIQGDSHTYKVDQPLLQGDARHGVDFPVPNLTRIVVEGETTSEYMRLTVTPRDPQPFSWERVQL